PYVEHGVGRGDTRGDRRNRGPPGGLPHHPPPIPPRWCRERRGSRRVRHPGAGRRPLAGLLDTPRLTVRVPDRLNACAGLRLRGALRRPGRADRSGRRRRRPRSNGRRRPPARCGKAPSAGHRGTAAHAARPGRGCRPRHALDDERTASHPAGLPHRISHAGHPDLGDLRGTLPPRDGHAGPRAAVHQRPDDLAVGGAPQQPPAL
ncbi:uncharacterized protein METZ01_LOCUS236912, partial [marine metagenome]